MVVRVENSLRFAGDCVIAQNPSFGIWEHEVAGSNRGSSAPEASLLGERLPDAGVDLVPGNRLRFPAFDLSDSVPDNAGPLRTQLERFGVEAVAQGLHQRLPFFLGQGQGVLEDLLRR